MVVAVAAEEEGEGGRPVQLVVVAPQAAAAAQAAGARAVGAQAAGAQGAVPGVAEPAVAVRGAVVPKAVEEPAAVLWAGRSGAAGAKPGQPQASP